VLDALEQRRLPAAILPDAALQAQPVRNLVLEHDFGCGGRAEALTQPQEQVLAELFADGEHRNKARDRTVGFDLQNVELDRIPERLRELGRREAGREGAARRPRDTCSVVPSWLAG
jgi:hypothetical protein